MQYPWLFDFLFLWIDRETSRVSAIMISFRSSINHSPFPFPQESRTIVASIPITLDEEEIILSVFEGASEFLFKHQDFI